MLAVDAPTELHNGGAANSIRVAARPRGSLCLPMRWAFYLSIGLWLCCFSPHAESQVLSGPLVVSDRWPQSTDLETWTRDVMRIEGVEDASETAQGKALFRWLRLFNRMAVGGMIQAYEGPHGDERYVLDAHKNLFVYGWGYCDTTSRIAEAAWTLYTGDRNSAQRVVTQHEDGGYHTMYRLRLDGNWGAFDGRYGYYLIDHDAADARILDWSEIGKDSNIRKNHTYRHRSQPFFEIFGVEWERAFLINECFYPSEEAWVDAGRPVECVFSDPKYVEGARFHDMSFRLPKGATIERFWDNSARKFYVPAGEHTHREKPFLPAGRFYRVTETMLDGNWPKHDPNHAKAEPYLERAPANEGYDSQVRGGRTIGQAWGRITYEPDLQSPEFLPVLAAESNLSHSSEAPYLRPPPGSAGGASVFDFYSPYVLVDGTLEGELAGAASIEIRTLTAKPQSRDQPDVWSDWRQAASGPGKFAVNLGREQFNGRDISLHGVYRFQVRVSATRPSAADPAAGLSALKLNAHFENGVMSIPQIFKGHNTVRFKVADSSLIRGPIEVAYHYQTAAGEKSHVQKLHASDFHNNEATYSIDAPGLTRCNSLAITY